MIVLRKTNFATLVMVYFLFSQTIIVSAEGIVVRTNPRQYRYYGAATVDNVVDRNNGVVLYMAYPESNEFQTIQPIRHSPGEIIPIPGNEFDKCLQVRLSSSDLKPGEKVVVFHEFQVTLYDIEIDFSKITDIRPYDVSSDLFKRYTSSADFPYINPTHPEIRQVSERVAKQATDYLDYARRAFLWAKENRLKDPGGGASSLCDPKSEGGGVTNPNAVLVSLLRCGGIPARIAIGRGTDRAIRFWSEFYLEGYGWIPANAGAKTETTQDKFHFFGRMSFPNRIGEIARSITMNYVYGANEFPAPISGGESIPFSSLAYFVIWGVSRSSGYSLVFVPVDGKENENGVAATMSAPPEQSNSRIGLYVLVGWCACIFAYKKYKARRNLQV